MSSPFSYPTPFINRPMQMATDQSKALSDPGDVTASTPVNPMEKTAFDTANNYASGLAGDTNEETKREVSRARDEVSGGIQKETEAAGARGADPSLFAGRAAAAGQRYVADVQGRMADSALKAKEGSVNALTGAAGQAAGGQRQLQLGTLSAQLGQQQEEDTRADQRARLEAAPYDRMADMFKSMMSSGFFSSGGMGTGSGSGSGFTGGITGTAGGGGIRSPTLDMNHMFTGN